MATASVLMTVTFVFHGPPEHHVGDQMLVIAGESTRWLTVHWMAAAALSFFAVAALLVLSAGSRLTESAWTVSAWAALPIGAFWTLITAVAEATAVTDAAVAGDEAAFATWWAFSEGMANGFAVLALTVAVIAGNEARSAQRVTPRWAAGVAVFAGLASFTGWALWSWIDLGFAAPIWVASSILMCLWLLWFATGLLRVDVAFAAGRRSAPSGA